MLFYWKFYANYDFIAQRPQPQRNQRRDQAQNRSHFRPSHHANSNPEIPALELLPNASVSTPMRWASVTNKFESGVSVFSSIVELRC